MSDAELRDFFQRYIDALNAHELHSMTEFIHDELIMNGHPVTRDDVIADQEDHTDAVPDFTSRVKDLAIDGDRVAARLFNQGTPTKEWFGVPPHRRHGRVCRVRLPPANPELRQSRTSATAPQATVSPRAA
ncbi:putative ester cyclase [Streptomyces phaeochromogenes]|uniref:ester cyclase n=1 Tax=Streptomyces phaeochromogenes TaxID=1923 RepID=UPI002792C009|nr:ester cyclase [Streptomyces phaeochromogenes]MDQ0946430.1 putative ester cyclase [Streptomyces phaeochromogenes]